MCGIVGYIGGRNAQEIILDGLRRLEYRGYDSAGVAILDGPGLSTVRSVGKLAALEARLAKAPLEGCLGIGHTRWATHGAPNEANAHPHTDAAGEIAVVHNGIIENFQALRTQLEADGAVLRSDTDTEVLPHLIRKHYQGDLLGAVRRTLEEVRGAYALGVVCAQEPGVLVAARHGSPLILGFGGGETFIASDVPAILRHTREVCYLAEGDICRITREDCTITDGQGKGKTPEIVRVDLDETSAEKEGHAHFMLKEIHQQPGVVHHALLSYVDEKTNEIRFPGLALAPELLASLSRIVLVACGTAWHAALVGKYLIEEFAQIPVEVDFSSEFRYAHRVLDAETLVVPVTQSGETADTLEAVRIARRQGAPVMAVVNVPGSTIAREAGGVLHTQAGPEIGVASTKAYTSQITMLALFAIYLARLRKQLAGEEVKTLLGHLRGMPEKMQWCLAQEAAVKRCARLPRYRDTGNAMFIGRGHNYPSALEGALKLKEISYIHVEGYAAGEMKHGPIALITDTLPVVCIAVKGRVYDKVISNIQEVRARGGLLLAIATEGDAQIAEYCNDVLYVPECYEPFSPLLTAIPLQLFAYHVADGLGRDVDQPRNLAKSVTVE